MKKKLETNDYICYNFIYRKFRQKKNYKDSIEIRILERMEMKIC